MSEYLLQISYHPTQLIFIRNPGTNVLNNLLNECLEQLIKRKAYRWLWLFL